MTLPIVLSFIFTAFLCSLVLVFFKRAKKAEEKQAHLNLENNRLQSAFNPLPQALCILDIYKNVIHLNKKATVLFSLHSSDLSLPDVLRHLPNAHHVAEQIGLALKTQETFIDQEVKIRDVLFNLEIKPLILNEKLLGIALIFHDLTLERSVSQMKEDFTNIISHELRSPLTTIRAASQFVRSQNGRLAEAERSKLLTMIDEQSQKLLYEIELILDAAKLEVGEFILHKTPGDLAQLLSEKVAYFLPQAEAKHIKITSAIENLPEVYFDLRYITQALTNIITNSLKFTQLGGNLQISAKEESGFICVSITDDGIGIPFEKQKALFSKFSHISSPSANIGTGLGLYIVKGIIEAHGGTISLTSDEGYGTSVSFTLPKDLPAGRQAPPPSSSENRPEFTSPNALLQFGSAVN